MALAWRCMALAWRLHGACMALHGAASPEPGRARLTTKRRAPLFTPTTPREDYQLSAELLNLINK